MSTKLTGLNRLQVRGIDEVLAPNDSRITTTATTATFDMSANEAHEIVVAAINSLPGREHPKASLHAVKRRLRAMSVKQSGDGPESLKAMFRF